MKRPISTAFPMLTLAALSAIRCEKADLMDPSRAALAVSARHPGFTRERPFRLIGQAQFQSQDFAPGFGPPEFGKSVFEGRCSGPSDFVIRFSLQAVATRLGKATATVEHCTQIDFQAGLQSISDGVMIVTAADGDQLRTRYWGAAPGPGQGVQEHHTFTGGTGKFSGASGGAVGAAECDQAAGTCVFEMTGQVIYDASDRRAR